MLCAHGVGVLFGPGQIRDKAAEYRAGRAQEAQLEADFFRQIEEQR